MDPMWWMCNILNIQPQEEPFILRQKISPHPQTLMLVFYLIRRICPHRSGHTNGIAKLYGKCHPFKASTAQVIHHSRQAQPLPAISRILWSIQKMMTLRLKIGSVKALRLHGIQCIDSLVSTNFRGTCAMKPREQGGVVDGYLNVYGTQNLKIAGRSIIDMANRRSFHLSWKCRLKYI